jgi:hypothetical protein
MQGDDQKIVAAAHFVSAGREQAGRVPARQDQLEQAQQRDQRDQPVREGAHVTCTSWKPAVKPGPSADIR